MLEILLACLAMAVKDAIYTGLTVAQARGYALVSGVLDALGDLATILVTLAGAGIVIVHGWTGHTMLVLGCMLVVSFFGTIVWTKLAVRWMPTQ